MPRKTARGICKNASYQIRLLEAHSKKTDSRDGPAEVD